MKIAHIGDCHVGRRPYGLRQREQDVQDAVEYVVSKAITLDADVFIWPGDVWQSVKPTAASVKFVQRMVDRLSRNEIVSVGIDGNHDGTDGKWLEIAGIHSLDGNPYTAKGITIAGFNNRAPSKMHDLVDDQNLDKCDVLVLHQAIAEMANFAGAELDLAFLDVFSEVMGARYVALGDIHQFHLHKTKDGRQYCYPGSVEVLTNDEPREKFFCMINITKKKLTVDTHPIETRPYRDVLVTSEEELADLAELFRDDFQAFFAVTVQDNINDGTKRCKALMKEAEVLGQVWLSKSDQSEEKVAWERKSAIIDVEAAVDGDFPVGGDENRLVKALLDNPGTVKEIVEEFVTTGKQ